ncbi:pentapeptide repeat-containing protein [Microcoleus sp. FACHB-SPT15]|nr:pentapeptide repeat-containing protein [Microcoleus sp. FACHB-SPT15]
MTKDNPRLDADLDVSRARTLSILRRLDGDGERKSSVVHFLIDAELIQGLDLLKDANLSGANLSQANLSLANLSLANLSDADFSLANLSDADFSLANLSDADFSLANLSQANLSQANLSQANLSRANLSQANLSQANLLGANLSGANLSGANLFKSNFKNTKNLTPEQVKVAENWDKAIYDPDFREQLGLPPESSS